MADFKKANILLEEVEFNRDSRLALHEVANDNGGLTYKGITKKFHPKWEGWEIIDKKINDLKKFRPQWTNKAINQQAGIELEKNEELQNLYLKFNKDMFWNKMKLDVINSQSIAENMYLFGYNAGIQRSVLRAQKIVNVVQDGIIGSKTISAINNYNPDKFCKEFTTLEKEYYEQIVSNNPSQQKFLNGWYKRADVV